MRCGRLSARVVLRRTRIAIIFAFAVILLFSGVSAAQVAVQTLLLATKSVPPGPTIQTVALSNNTFTASVPNGQVGVVSVTMSDTSAFAGSLQVTGTNSGGFHMSGNALQESSSGGTPAGTYNDFNIVATQASASNSPQQISPTVTGSGGGGTAFCNNVPAGATAANMTQLIYCADFSSPAYATQSSPGYFNLANGWFGCVGNNNQHEWYQTYLFGLSAGPGPYPPCSNWAPGSSDGANGTALKVHWNGADCGPNNCNGQANASVNAMQNGLWGGNNGGSGFWSMPTNYYYSIKVRATSAVSGSYQAADTIGLATYLFDTTSIDQPSPGGFNSLELDPVNWEADNNPCCNQFGYINNWGNGNSPNTVINAGAIDITTPHTFAILVRNNGSAGGSNGTACEFIDNSQVGSCPVAINPTSHQANNYRGIVIHSMGNLARSFDMYIYGIQVFTRSGCDAAHTACLGTTN